MTEERRRSLDAEALALFARKGAEGGPAVPQAGPANAVKVRRILTLTRDLSRRPFETLRILDLGCGEGVYAIEAALLGASVVAIDARTVRMNAGAAVAARHGLSNVEFRQEDVRRVSRETHGAFDVVWCLGLLYHLDVPDVFPLLERLREMCGGLLVVDTLVAERPDLEIEHGGRRYEGARVREHEDADPPEVRASRPLRSLDNTFSFRFGRDALVRALGDVGFASVLEAKGPLEPGKAPDRVTLVAVPGEPSPVAAYPWIAGLTEREIADRLLAGGAAGSAPREPELSRWIEGLFRLPELLRMGHNQRAADRNLGLGWLYYALARVVRPRSAVVIGSWRGFVPLVLGRALADNLEPGEVTFVDPSFVDDFWEDPERVRAWFEKLGVENVRHVRATTQEFVATPQYASLGEIGLLFVDGYHSAEQARFDWKAFETRLSPHGLALFHDSLSRRRSDLYGADRAYDVDVRGFLDELRRDPSLEVLDLPYGTGLSIVRKSGGPALEPLLEGLPARR